MLEKYKDILLKRVGEGLNPTVTEDMFNNSGTVIFNGKTK